MWSVPVRAQIELTPIKDRYSRGDTIYVEVTGLDHIGVESDLWMMSHQYRVAGRRNIPVGLATSVGVSRVLFRWKEDFAVYSVYILPVKDSEEVEVTFLRHSVAKIPDALGEDAYRTFWEAMTGDLMWEVARDNHDQLTGNSAVSGTIAVLICGTAGAMTLSTGGGALSTFHYCGIAVLDVASDVMLQIAKQVVTELEDRGRVGPGDADELRGWVSTGQFIRSMLSSERSVVRALLGSAPEVFSWTDAESGLQMAVKLEADLAVGILSLTR